MKALLSMKIEPQMNAEKQVKSQYRRNILRLYKSQKGKTLLTAPSGLFQPQSALPQLGQSNLHLLFLHLDELSHQLAISA